jgi:K(+)-stimulated pyrophosphate-energized sodium pump
VDAVPYIAALSAIAALVLAFAYFRNVGSASPGNERMVYLMNEIQKGAKAFLRKQYQWVSVFVVAMAALLAVVITPLAAVTYVLGALLSAGAGYVGMTVATMANARTTEAAKEGPGKALPIAFRGGAVMGFSVAGLALLGLSLTYLVFVTWLEVDEAFEIVTAFGLGASSIALFARVGGGIYTKAADVGADLVGKVEAGIPEDDPRNPATIADNVGDNVGDVAGMGADLFESYAGSIIAPLSLTAFAVGLTAQDAGADVVLPLLMFPFGIAAVGMLASILGSFFVKGGDSTESHALSRALHLGTNIAMALTAVATVGLAYWLFSDEEFFDKPWGLALSVIGGLVVGWALGKAAEYYTSDQFTPVKKIAAQSETGPATTILGGISTGMVSVAASIVLILVGVGIAYWGGEQTLGAENGGVYGIAVAAIGMLATTGIVVSVDAYGPIADNAGGIAEMAELDPSVRNVTDALDSLGNTTAAVAKGSPWARRRSPLSRCSRASSTPCATPIPPLRSISTSATSRCSSACSSAPAFRSCSPR